MAQHRITSASVEKDPLAAFKAADGTRIWVGGMPMVLRAGAYGNGAGALYFEHEGQPFGKVTVNITDEPGTTLSSLILMPLRFFVKLAELDEKARLLDLGICREHDLRVSAGFVDNYAQVWEFAECPEARCPMIQCEACREALAADFKKHYERALAKDSLRRLKEGWRA